MEIWKAFNWDVHTKDGNNLEQLSQELDPLDANKGQPHVVTAETIFGKGASFMEKEIKWHDMPLSLEEYHQSLAELDQS